MAEDVFMPETPDFERVARLGMLGNRLIALGVGATVVGGIAAIAAPARSAGAVVVAVLLGLTVGLWVFLVHRDRDVLDWTRSYPTRIFGTEDGAWGLQDASGPPDTELESLLNLDEDSQTALQAGRRYDLGLAVAMVPGLVLLLFAALAYRPLSPVLQVIRAVGYMAVFPICAVGIGVPAVRQDAQGPRMRSQARVFRVVWLGVVVLAFAWSLNGAADPGPGTIVPARIAHGYHDPAATHVSVAATLRLASVPGYPTGLPIYDPAAAWAGDHAAGDPVRLTVGPGALGMPVIRRLEVGERH